MKCPFACVSKAYHSDDEREPIEGTRNLAAVAHKHGIPVTWILTERAATALASELAAWHRDFGDEVAAALVRLPVAAHAYALRREAIRNACPWSDVRIAGSGGGKSERMLAALDQAGFAGLWGYCWEQVYEDGISDYGQPPGLFIASPASYKMPAPDGRGLVAVEWLSRDLNKAFWTANAINFAGEPDALLRFGDWDRAFTLRYASHLVGQYVRNAAAGWPLPYIFQEEAAQLMPGLINADYDRLWNQLLAWIDDFLGGLDRSALAFTTLPALVAEFRASPQPRQLVRARDLRGRKLTRPDRDHAFIWGGEWEFPEVAHYSDAQRFCTFVVGNPAPVRLIRYDRQQEVGVHEALVPESVVPRLLALEMGDGTWRAKIRSPEAMPYALALDCPLGARLPAGFAVNEDIAVWPINVRAGEHWHKA